MSMEEYKLINRHFAEETVQSENMHVCHESYVTNEHEALTRQIFFLALIIAAEPSKLAHLRQVLMQIQEQRGISEDFSTWAIRQIDERIMSMALEYASDAEYILQILSFKGGTFDSLLHTIEDMYRQEKITQRVYARAKLLLR